MRYFEDLQVGETLTQGGLVVELADAEHFARHYDPALLPAPGRAYIHRGPEVSPWQAAALSWKLLSDLSVAMAAEEAVFSSPRNVEWHNKVHVGDALRLVVELVELLPPNTHLREHGWARSNVTLITTGPAGFGAWGDDDQELVDDVALTYIAHLKARRREVVSPFHGMS